AVERVAGELEVGPQRVDGPWRLHDHGRLGGDDHVTQRVDVDLARADVRVPIRARPGRVARVVEVEQVDAARDRASALDGVGQVLARGVRVAGVEAEADLDIRLRDVHGLPELRQRVEAPRDRVVPARRVLEVHGNL